MKGREDILRLLDEKGIEYTSVEHPAAHTVEDILSFNIPHPEYGAKNLFLRDDKKRNYYLLSVRYDLKADIKEFRRRAGTRSLTFASEEDMMKYLGLTPGSVSPFGVLNDETHAVKVYMDSYFEDGMISVHPNDNTITVYLKVSDLKDIITESGSSFEFIGLE